MSDATIVGIDPSSKTMASVMSTQGKIKLRKEIWKGSVDTIGAKLHALSTNVSNFIAEEASPLDDELVVYIEAPVLGRSVRATVVQAQAQGAVISSLSEWFDVEAYQVNNKTWKKDIVGNGNASKPQVAQWVKEHYPKEHARVGGDQDLIDAFCIMLYAKEKYELRERIRQGVS